MPESGAVSGCVPSRASDSVRATLRLATAGDDLSLKAVYASTRPELTGLPWSPQESDAFLAFQSMAQEQHYRTTYPALQRLLIEQDGQTVGRLYRAETAADYRLVDLALLPEFRGQGLGTALVRGEVERAQAAGAVLRLHVEQNNPARRLYERLGFVLEDHQGIYLALKRLPI